MSEQIPKPRYKKEGLGELAGFDLIKFHLSWKTIYMFGHAIIAGRLAKDEFKTFSEYRKACRENYVGHHTEEAVFEQHKKDMAEKKIWEQPRTITNPNNPKPGESYFSSTYNIYQHGS